MLFILNIAIGKRPVREVSAEVDLVEPRSAIPPDVIEGRLLLKTREEFLEFKDNGAVAVGVLGRRYKFGDLDENGKFKLLLDSEEAKARTGRAAPCGKIHGTVTQQCPSNAML